MTRRRIHVRIPRQMFNPLFEYEMEYSLKYTWDEDFWWDGGTVQPFPGKEWLDPDSLGSSTVYARTFQGACEKLNAAMGPLPSAAWWDKDVSRDPFGRNYHRYPETAKVKRVFTLLKVKEVNPC